MAISLRNKIFLNTPTVNNNFILNILLINNFEVQFILFLLLSFCSIFFNINGVFGTRGMKTNMMFPFLFFDEWKLIW